MVFYVFFFNDTATTEIYTLSLHDALPISSLESGAQRTNQLERVGGLFGDFRESRTENGTEEPLRGVRHSAFEETATSVNPFASQVCIAAPCKERLFECAQFYCSSYLISS